MGVLALLLFGYAFPWAKVFEHKKERCKIDLNHFIVKDNFYYLCKNLDKFSIKQFSKGLFITNFIKY